MTDRLEELIWMELDGELGAEEARELAELLSGSSSAAADAGGLEAEIRELAAELGRVEDVPVPAELGRRVLAAIEPSRSPAAEPQGARVLDLAPRPTGSGSAIGRSIALPTAAAGGWGQWRRWGYLAAGLGIVGVLVFQLLPQRPGSESPSEMVGTVPAAPETGAAVVPEGGAVAAMPAAVRLSQSDGRLWASLTPGAGDSVFVFRAPGLEIDRVEFEDGARGTYEVTPGQITLRVAGPGRVEARLLLARPERPFRVSASGGDLESIRQGVLSGPTFATLTGSSAMSRKPRTADENLLGEETDMSDTNKSKKFLWIVIGAGVLAAAIYFSGVMPSSEDVSGTIRGAERHRAPQIAEADLGMGGAPTVDVSALSDAEKAELFDKTVEAARLDGLARLGLNRADVERMDAKAKAEELGRVMQRAADDGLARLGLNRVDVERLDAKAKAEELGRVMQRAADDGLARLGLRRADVERMDAKAKAEELGRVMRRVAADGEARFGLDRAVIGRLDAKAKAEELGRVMQRAADDGLARFGLNRADVERMGLEAKAEELGRLMQRVGADDLGRLGLNRADVERMDAKAKAEELGRVMQRAAADGLNRLGLNRVDVERMGLEAKAEELGRVMQRAADDGLGRLGLNRVDVERLDAKAKAEELGRVMQRAAADGLARFGLNRVDVERMDAKAKAIELGRVMERAAADGLARFGLNRVDVERMDAKAKAVELGRVMERATADGLSRLGLNRADIGRMGMEAKALELGRVMERAPSDLRRLGLERFGLERLGLERTDLDSGRIDAGRIDAGAKADELGRGPADR